MAQFHISNRGYRKGNINDDVGTVKVTCILMETGNKPKTGNISRTISLADTKVSLVMAAIRKALIDE